ncbi:MAG TPA: metallophosphoesterase [Burkholderiales bacterium]|nr:metallophosphoesterase [Burkholderiales bacterium]
MTVDRRQFLKLAGLGGAVFASGLGCASTPMMEGPAGGAAYPSAQDDFFFVQLSDTHWGFRGPAVNPDAAGTLPKAVAAVNALETQPDFIVFTGDLTHTTDNPLERRRRLAGFRDIAKGLKNRNVRFMPGEHDASLDHGKAFSEFFGATHYTFDHKGVHFIVLDNVSDPAARIGEEQLGWLRADLAQRKSEERIVVFTHRPLFPLYPAWDWATRDGDQAIAALMPFRNVAVFYGHIHQEHHFKTAHIEHHSAKSLIFPLPAAGSQPKREPVKWDPAQPYRGLGWREVEAEAKPVEYKLAEMPVVKA